MACGLLEHEAVSPPQALIDTDIFNSFLNHLRISASTACCGSDIQYCNYTLGEKVPPLVALSLFGSPPQLPWVGQEWTVIHTSCYGPRGTSHTFCLPADPGHLRASGCSLIPLFQRRAEAPLPRWVQQERLGFGNIDLFFAPCPPSNRFDFFFSLSLQQIKLLLSIYFLCSICDFTHLFCTSLSSLLPTHIAISFQSKYLFHWLLPCMKVQYSLVFYCSWWTFLQYACSLSLLQFCCILLETRQPKQHQGFMMWWHRAFTQQGSEHCGCVLLTLR